MNGDRRSFLARVLGVGTAAALTAPGESLVVVPQPDVRVYQWIPPRSLAPFQVGEILTPARMNNIVAAINDLTSQVDQLSLAVFGQRK